MCAIPQRMGHRFIFLCREESKEKGMPEIGHLRKTCSEIDATLVCLASLRIEAGWIPAWALASRWLSLG